MYNSSHPHSVVAFVVVVVAAAAVVVVVDVDVHVELDQSLTLDAIPKTQNFAKRPNQPQQLVDP